MTGSRMRNELGKQIRSWRDKRSQAEVGAVLGVKQSTVAYWESGKKRPHLLRAADIEEKTEGAVTKEAIEAAHRKKKAR